MNFNRTNIKALRADIATALAAVEKQHGVSFKLGNIRFTDNDFRGKLECFSASDNSGKAVDVDKQNFESKAFLVGVKPTSFGKTFTQGTRTYTICGINTRARTYPIKARLGKGQYYKFPVSALPKNLRS